MRSLNIRKKIILIFSVIAAAIIRYYVFFHMMITDNPNGLMVSYLDEAMNIVEGGEWFMGYLNGNYQLLVLHPKGFSLLLVVLIKLFGNGYLTALHWLMLAADVSVCVFLFLIVRKIFKSDTAAILVSWLWALNPHAIINAAQDEPDSFACFFVAVLVYLYFREYKKEGMRYLVLGLWCGFAHYFRAEFMLFVPTIWLADMIAKRNIIHVSRKWIYCILAFFVINAPWMVYSKVKTGHVMISSQNAGGAAYEAIGDNPNNSLNVHIGDEYVTEEALELGYDGPWTYDANNYFKQQWISYVTTYPEEYAETIMTYRIPEAFVPRSYVYFNLNIPYTTNRYKDTCHYVPGESRIDACWLSTYLAVKFEGGLDRKISVFFLINMIAFTILCIRKKKLWENIFLFAVYLYFPLAISALKQIEPRNIAGNQVILVIAAGMVIYWVIQYFKQLILRLRSRQ